jgi:hypothetical protein
MAPARRALHYAWTIVLLGHLNIFCALGLGRFSYAMILPSMKAGLGLSWFAPRRRSMAAGIQAVGSGLGLITSALAVPLILAGAGPEGWRHAWLFLAGLVVLVWACTVGWLRDRPEEVGALPLGATQAFPPASAGPPP